MQSGRGRRGPCPTGLTRENGAMRFMTGDPEVPILVRLCRNLLLTEAGLMLLAAAFFLLAARGDTAGTVTTQAGLSVGTEGIIWLAAALVVAIIAVNVGRLVAWARWVAVGLEIVLLGFLLEEWVRGRGNLLPTLLAVAVLGILLSPSVGRAFTEAAVERSRGAVTGLPPSPGDQATAEARVVTPSPARVAHSPGDRPPAAPSEAGGGAGRTR